MLQSMKIKENFTEKIGKTIMKFYFTNGTVAKNDGQNLCNVNSIISKLFYWNIRPVDRLNLWKVQSRNLFEIEKTCEESFAKIV